MIDYGCYTVSENAKEFIENIEKLHKNRGINEK